MRIQQSRGRIAVGLLAGLAAVGAGCDSSDSSPAETVEPRITSVTITQAVPSSGDATLTARAVYDPDYAPGVTRLRISQTSGVVTRMLYLELDSSTGDLATVNYRWGIWRNLDFQTYGLATCVNGSLHDCNAAGIEIDIPERAARFNTLPLYDAAGGFCAKVDGAMYW